MKKILSVILSFVLVISSFSVVTIAQTENVTELVYMQDFDGIKNGSSISDSTSKLGGWGFTSDNAGSEAHIISEMENNFLRVSADNIDDELVLSSNVIVDSKELLLGGYYEIEIQYTVRNEFSDNSLILNDETGRVIAAVDFDASGYVKYRGDGSNVDLGTYDLNEWYSIRFAINTENKSVDLKLNETEYSGLNFCDTMASNMYLMSVVINTTTASVGLDNVKIYGNYSESSYLALNDSFSECREGETFSDGATYSGWKKKKMDKTSKAQIVLDSQNKVMRIQGDPSGEAVVERTLPVFDSNAFDISADYTIGVGIAYHTIKFINSNGNIVGTLFFNKVQNSTDIYYNDVVVGQYSVGVKFNVRVSFYENLTADVYIDGVKKTEQPFAPTTNDTDAVNRINIFHSAVGSNSYLYVDNVIMKTKATAPTESVEIANSEKNYNSYVVKDTFEEAILDEQMKTGGVLGNWNHKTIGSNGYIKVGGDSSNKYLEYYNIGANEVATTRTFPYDVEGEVNIDSELYISKAEAYVEYSLMDASEKIIAKIFLDKKNVIYFNDNNTKTFSAGGFMSLKFKIDTNARTVDLYFDGVKFTEEPLSYYDENAGLPRKILLKESAGNGTYLRLDNFSVYYDYADELREAFSSVKNEDISEEELTAITQDLKPLNQITRDGFDISFSVNDENALSTIGVITRRNYQQKVKLTCVIKKESQLTFVEEAYINKVFDIVIKAKDGASTEDLLNDILEYYVTLDKITDQPALQIERNLFELPKIAPNGVELSWSSSNQEIISDEGGVVRPLWREDDTPVTLTVTASLGEVGISKDFEFIVLNELSPQERFEIVMPMLEIRDLSNEQANDVKTDLKLVYRFDEYDVDISWSSSNSDVISNSGIVTRGQKDIRVRMTATFSFDGFSDTKTFDFTVKTSPEYMVSQEKMYLELKETVVTDDFILPLKGELYTSTSIVWTSDNSSSIAISGDKAMITRPTYEQGDTEVCLTATLTNESFSDNKEFYITVKALPSDEVLVNEAAEKLVFSYISAEKEDAVKNNLSLQSDFKNGVICQWTSTESEVVNPATGEVINPEIGAEPVDVTLTAIVKKGSVSSEPIIFNITVLPFENEEELLTKAKNALKFSELSTEDIDLVENDLYLPLNWKYNTRIEWESSDASVLEISSGDDVYQNGIVNKNEIGYGFKTVDLKATLTYGEKTTTKEFFVTVVENDGWVNYLQEDFNSFKEKENPYSSKARWSMCLTSQGNHWVTPDPTDSGNMVLMVNKPAKIDRPETFPSSTCFLNEGVAMTGLSTISFKIYMDENTTEEFILEPYLSTSAFSATFNGVTNTVKFGNVVVNDNFEKGKWINVEIVLDCDKKESYLYLDGICQHEENPYRFSVDGPVYGIRFRASQASCVTDTLFYMDDLCYSTFLTDYNDNLLESIANFETKFFLYNDLSSMTKDLKIPESDVDISYYSQNPSVVSDDGLIGSGGQTIFYIKYKSSNGEITKPYVINVAQSGERLSEEEMAAKDIDKLLERYDFNRLTENININSATYGSEITIESSNEQIISESGVVKRPANDTPVKLTIISTNGEKSVSKDVEVVVKGTKTVDSTSGNKTVSSYTVSYGGSSKKNSGIKTEDSVQIEQSFADLNKNHWAYDNIMLLVKHELIDGYKNQFMPEKNVVREDVIKAIVLALGYEVKDYGNNFDDVSKSSKYYEYLSTAKYYKITLGEGDNRFGMGKDITREDLCTMIVRGANALVDPIKTNNPKSFLDVNTVSDYASDSVRVLSEKDIIRGDDLGNFNPKNNCTRAEFCTIISRLIGGTSND